jgi:hypothetical protein
MVVACVWALYNTLIFVEFFRDYMTIASTQELTSLWRCLTQERTDHKSPTRNEH